MLLRNSALVVAALFAISLLGLPSEATARTRRTPAGELATAATPAEKVHVPEGFKVELLYSVPKEEEGSWVNICYDPKGRLIVSDQYGSLYRITLPAAGSSAEVQIEKIPVEIGMAHG